MQLTAVCLDHRRADLPLLTRCFVLTRIVVAEKVSPVVEDTASGACNRYFTRGRPSRPEIPSCSDVLACLCAPFVRVASRNLHLGAWPAASLLRVATGYKRSALVHPTYTRSSSPTNSPISSYLSTHSTIMFSALIPLALAAAASAKTLRAATTSPYGQSSLNFEPFNTTYGVALSGRNPVPATIRANLDDAGNLVMECPYAGYIATLVPTDPVQSPAAYHVQFVESTDGLPSEAIVGGWAVSADRYGLSNDNYTKVENTLVSAFLSTLNTGALTFCDRLARACTRR